LIASCYFSHTFLLKIAKLSNLRI